MSNARWHTTLTLLLVSLYARHARPASVFNMTLLHDTMTFGGVFEADGDGDECKLNISVNPAFSIPTTATNVDPCAGGAAMRQTFFKEARAAYPNVVSVSMNHLFFGASIYFAKPSAEAGAKHIAESYVGPCKYDAISLDTTEFFAGAPPFASFARNLPDTTAILATYLTVNPNSTDWDDNKTLSPTVGAAVAKKILPSVVLNRTGHFVAIMALSGYELSVKSNAGDTVAALYDDPNDGISGCVPCVDSYLLKATQKIRQEYNRLIKQYPAGRLNTLILMSKFGRSTNTKLAQNLEILDVIVEAEEPKENIRHTTEVVNEISGGKVLIVNSLAVKNQTSGTDDKGERGRTVGVVSLSFDENGILLSNTGALVNIRKGATDPPRPAIIQDSWFDDTIAARSQMAYDSQVVKNWTVAALGTVSAEVYGIDGKQYAGNFFFNNGCRAADCGLGRLTTAALMHHCKKQNPTGCHISFVNGGALRGSLSAGTVTNNDIVTVIPFDNKLTRTTVPGSFVRSWVEHAVYSEPNLPGSIPGKFLQSKGLRYAWNPITGKVLSIFVYMNGKWSPLVDSTMYEVVTSEFISRGGDKFPPMTTYSPAFLNVQFHDAVAKYVEYLKPNGYQVNTATLSACLGDKVDDVELRLPTGCGSMKSSLNVLYSSPNDVVLALMLPNSTAPNSGAIVAAVRAAAYRFGTAIGVNYDVRVYNTNGTEHAGKKILNGIKRVEGSAGSTTPLIILGPLLSSVAYGSKESNSLVYLSTHSLVGEAPFITATFGASAERENVAGKLFRRVCVTDLDRVRAIDSVLSIKKWNRAVFLTQFAYSGAEFLTHAFVANVKTMITSEVPGMVLTNGRAMSSLADDISKSQETVFLLLLETLHIKDLIDALKPLPSKPLDSKIFVLPTSSGIHHFPEGSQVISIGRREPLAEGKLGTVTVNAARASGSLNVTTDEVLLGAYDSVAFASAAVSSLVTSRTQFTDLNDNAANLIADTVKNSFSTFSFNTHGDRIAVLDLLMINQGIDEVGKWTLSAGLDVTQPALFNALPNAFRPEKSNSNNAGFNTSVLVAVIIILVVIAVLVWFGWMFDKKNLKELLLSKSDVWRINEEEVELRECIGKGAYGKVYRGLLGSTTVAIKQFDDSTIKSDEFVAEFSTLVDLRHKHLVQFVGAIVESQSIVTDFMERGDLEGVLKDPGNIFSQKQLGQFCLDVALGLEYLHSRGVAHCDMKTANVLVDKNFIAKIADFGLSWANPNSRKRKRTSASFRTEVGKKDAPNKNREDGAKGTMLWLPPEVIEGGKYEMAGDVFAYALVVSEIVTRRTPFHDVTGMNQYALSNAIASKGLRPTWTNQDHVPDLIPIIAIAEKCWEKEAKNRLTAKKLCKALANCMTDLGQSSSSHSSVIVDRSDRAKLGVGEQQHEHPMSQLTSGALGESELVDALGTKPYFVHGQELFHETSPSNTMGVGYLGASLTNIGDVFLIPLKYRLGKNVKRIHRNVEKVVAEIDILSSLSHCNILPFLKATNDGHFDEGFLVFASVDWKVSKPFARHSETELSRLNFHRILQILGQICDVLAYLHGKNVTHGLLSSHSVLFNQERCNVTVCRYEKRIVVSNRHELVSDADDLKGWLAPEVLVLDHFTPSCDVFSFGVFMWYLLTLKNPFEKDSAMSVNRKVVNDEARPPITLKDMKKLEAYKRELYDKETGLTYVDLIHQCWAQKIEKRMKLADAVRVLKEFEDLVKARDESKEASQRIATMV
jgi:serine/threonine protein kinase/2',3'-cyclic-nucleotide 2'-phosphodiesterase (5'-nucleotidase family)